MQRQVNRLVESSPGINLKHRRIFLGVILCVSLLFSGVIIWTFYQEKEKQSLVLRHADEFLKRWHLPARSEFSSVYVGKREPKLKDRISVVLEKLPGQTITLRHRPSPPFITYAHLADLGLPKLARSLDENDAGRLVKERFGDKASITQEPLTTPDMLILSIDEGNGKTRWTARFDVETGQLRQAVMSERP